MPKIKCPKCGEVFSVDDSTYAEILSQVKTNEFEKELSRRVEEIEKQNKAQLELVKEQTKNSQDKTINELKEKIQNLESANKLNEVNIRNENKDEVERLKKELEEAKKQNQIDSINAKNDQEKAIESLKAENKLLQEKLDNTGKDIELAVAKALEASKTTLSEKNEEIAKLQGDIELAKKNKELEVKQIIENNKFLLEAKDEEIKRWKEFRMGDSTKDLGESLEVYCRDTFEEVHMMAYPNATFVKDTKADEEGEGDYIFRDFQDGIETVSVMFEMKNQKDPKYTHHKNEEFFKKLDKNRSSKGCEYAVLVSTLEPDSKLYNNGIVDVSHKYPKMFVIRPQFFLTFLGLLRGMANNTYDYKRQVIEYQRENIDIVNFEKAVKAVAEKISTDYEHASTQYKKVDKYIGDAIKALEELREAHRLMGKWIGAAQNQLPDLEIRKLTKNNPTMKAKFEAIDNTDTKDKE